MDAPQSPVLPLRMLEVLEGLLRIPAGDLATTLAHVSDLVAAASGVDKVDAFLYEPARDSLVAVGTSTQPLSALQRQLGLDVLPVSNGGRVVHVFKTGQTFVTGALDADTEELRGVREALGIRSKLGVPLEIGGRRRGMLMLASLQPDFFTPEDVAFIESTGRWIGILVHRAELAAEIARNALEQGRRAGAEELVTVLAHDLRNYLGPLNMRLELLRLRAERDGRAEDLRDAAAAARSVLRLGALVSDILDVARLDQGVFQTQPEPLELGALVRDTAAMLSTPEHPVTVRLQEDTAFELVGDAARLRQCLENIIANALQKSPSKAPVSVFVHREAARPDGPLARVEVIDEGPGIPEDLLPHV
ncbi:MAG TPA: GAF domain-containing protein, partial [Burkholderiales bacterium]|nr:GAF domain-containing protein [Burkholderiales bacterium]